MRTDRDVWYEAYHAASGSALERSCVAFEALGRHHASDLRRERICMQKRHARQILHAMRNHRTTFDFAWFRAESRQNDRTIRIAERTMRRFWRDVFRETGT